MPTALSPVQYLARYVTGEAASSRSDEAVRVLDPRAGSHTSVPSLCHPEHSEEPVLSPVEGISTDAPASATHTSTTARAEQRQLCAPIRAHRNNLFDAISAPARIARNFSHTISSATSPSPAEVSKPQSVPATTRRASPTACPALSSRSAL